MRPELGRQVVQVLFRRLIHRWWQHRLVELQVMRQQGREDGGPTDGGGPAGPPDVQAVLRRPLPRVIVALALGRERSTGQAGFQERGLGLDQLRGHWAYSFPLLFRRREAPPFADRVPVAPASAPAAP